MRYTQKHPQHTYIKRDVYYFSRVIPSDLKHHYSKPRIIQSLKTKSARRATVASKMLSAKLDDYWLGLRLKRHSPSSLPMLGSILSTEILAGISKAMSPSEALSMSPSRSLPSTNTLARFSVPSGIVVDYLRV